MLHISDNEIKCYTIRAPRAISKSKRLIFHTSLTHAYARLFMLRTYPNIYKLTQQNFLVNVWGIYWFMHSLCVCVGECFHCTLCNDGALSEKSLWSALLCRWNQRASFFPANWLIEPESNRFSIEIKVVWSARVNFLEIKLFDALKFWHLHDPIKSLHRTATAHSLIYLCELGGFYFAPPKRNRIALPLLRVAECTNVRTKLLPIS